MPIEIIQVCPKNGGCNTSPHKFWAYPEHDQNSIAHSDPILHLGQKIAEFGATSPGTGSDSHPADMGSKFRRKSEAFIYECVAFFLRYGGFLKWGYPSYHPFDARVFPYQPSNLGTPSFRKAPYKHKNMPILIPRKPHCTVCTLHP